MRKSLIVVLVFFVSLFVSGCSSSTEQENEKLTIVTTIYPIYDWINEIAGDNVDVSYLVDSGIDLHNYDPSVNDIIEIKESDLFIYIGGHSDDWVEDVLNEDSNSINLLEELGDYVLYYDHEHDDDDHDHDEYEEDEHIWMSLNNAIVLVEAISNKLIELDPSNEIVYIDNTNRYLTQLNNLELEYFEVISDSNNNVIVVADRFPLLYMVSDYGIEYYAAYTGCEAEIEVSFETIIELSNIVEELSLKYILTIEGSSNEIAETIIENTSSVEMLEINSMQSIVLNNLTSEDSYLSIMRDNLDIIKVALN